MPMFGNRPFLATLAIIAVSAHAAAVPTPVAAQAAPTASQTAPVFTPQQAKDAAAAASAITAADVLQRLRVIADDSMRGRDTPSPGLEMTAEYVAAHFRALGLQPAGDSGTFIQRYSYAARHVDTKNKMIQVNGAPKLDLSFGTDFFVVPSDVETVDGSPYYAGFVSTSFNVPASARGRIVIAAIPDTLGGPWGMRLNALLTSAISVGAKAVIIVLDPRVTADNLATIAGPISEQSAPLMIFGVRAPAIAQVLRAAHVDPTAVFSATSPAPPADMPGITMHLSTVSTIHDARVPNVVAIMRGSDPVLRDEYVVFSAHMDHVGVGAADAKGDSIYNGADDDGSGTTAIMEIARAFAALPAPPRRSIIFLTVSGEEKGLLGSDYFTAHAPVPVSSIVADINIDMIGRNNPDSVTAIGIDYTSLGPIAQAAGHENRDIHLTVAPDLQPEEHLFERSDHFNFAKKNIPAIFFTSGLHKDYHRPSDEVRTIDTDKLARVAQLAFYVGNTVASMTARPTWTKAGLTVVKAAVAGGQ